MKPEGTTVKSDKKATNKRPTIISIICILGFIGVGLTFAASILNVVLDFQSIDLDESVGHFLYLIFALFLGTISFHGLWNMKESGLNAYLLLFVTSQAYLANIHLWTPKHLLIPLIIIAILLFHQKKLT